MPLEAIHLSTPSGAARPGPSDSGSGFTATAEELNAISKKMGDPEFMKLMHEYMAAMQDPETRREEEAYLRQIEAEASEPVDPSAAESSRTTVPLSDLSKYQFIFPMGCFSVELLDRPVTAGGGPAQRVFINVCSSDRIDQFKEQSTSNARASHWFIPVSVSRVREVLYDEVTATSSTAKAADPAATGPTTTSNELVKVYDAVFHPLTVSLADQSQSFLAMVLDVVREQIREGYKVSFGEAFQRLPSRIQSISVPQNQTVQRQNKAPKGKASPPATAPPASVDGRPAATPAPSPAPLAATPSPTMHSPTPAPPALPPFTIAHRGHMRILDTWEGWRTLPKHQTGDNAEEASSGAPLGVAKTTMPEELSVSMFFAEAKSCPREWQVATVAELHVRLADTVLDLERRPLASDAAGDGAPLVAASIPLPYTVHEDPVTAVFNKTTKELKLVLKVVQPPSAPAVPPGRDTSDDTDSSVPTQATAAEAVPEGAVASPAAEETVPAPAAVESATPSVTAAATVSDTTAAEPQDFDARSSVPTTTVAATGCVEESQRHDGSTPRQATECQPVVELPSAVATGDTVLPRAPEGVPMDGPRGGDNNHCALPQGDAPAPLEGIRGHFSHLGDSSRVQLVLQKLAEARRERREREELAAAHCAAAPAAEGAESVEASTKENAADSATASATAEEAHPATSPLLPEPCSDRNVDDLEVVNANTVVADVTASATTLEGAEAATLAASSTDNPAEVECRVNVDLAAKPNSASSATNVVTLPADADEESQRAGDASPSALVEGQRAQEAALAHIERRKRELPLYSRPIYEID